MKIAVVGGGVAGLGAAWLLSTHHDVTLYEREARLGGHSNTLEARFGDETVAVDTGFIVFNHANYPELTALLSHLGVASEASDMSFAASLGDGEFEYGSGNLAFFGQPANLLDRRFRAFLGDIFRFNRLAPRWQARQDSELTVGDWLAEHGFGDYFAERFLLPLSACIWSSSTADMARFPFAQLVEFFRSHRLFNIWRQQKWRTVKGGSRSYVARLAAPLRQHARLATPASFIRRQADGVVVGDAQGNCDRFDHVVIAAHADQAVSLLANPSPAERSVLGAFRYSAQDTYLHSDAGLMPRRRAVWSSWNFVAPAHQPDAPVAVTYWMNRLQNIPKRYPLFVSNNPHRAPAQGTVHARLRYEHPIFDRATFAAQRRLADIQGADRIWYCGSYFGFGFHEDALASGLDIAEQFGVSRPWRPRPQPRPVRGPAPLLLPGAGVSAIKALRHQED